MCSPSEMGHVNPKLKAQELGARVTLEAPVRVSQAVALIPADGTLLCLQGPRSCWTADLRKAQTSGIMFVSQDAKHLPCRSRRHQADASAPHHSRSTPFPCWCLPAAVLMHPATPAAATGNGHRLAFVEAWLSGDQCFCLTA